MEDAVLVAGGASIGKLGQGATAPAHGGLERDIDGERCRRGHVFEGWGWRTPFARAEHGQQLSMETLRLSDELHHRRSCSDQHSKQLVQ